jgi:uncharacterized protein (DUF1330 family)
MEFTMNRHITLALAVVAGAAFGAAAVQGLHAQAKPKAYYVVEIEPLDATANAAYAPVVQAAQRTGGARQLGTAGQRIVAFDGGAPPKSVAISEWDSMEQVQAYRNSAAFKNLAPQRDKAIKIIRSYAVEATAN